MATMAGAPVYLDGNGMSYHPSQVVEIPGPLPHQEPAFYSPARFKVLRAGRRGGKTVFAECCAVIGHGPTLPNGQPMFKAIAQGYDVVWLARDSTQSSIMWEEFIKPRFKGRRGVRVVETPQRVVQLAGGGTLWVMSAENIASIRGVGAKLAGVIVEEAAWMALRDALRNVILPALMDNEGWLVLISTTNAGTDGGKDDAGQPQVPSFFNLICEQIRDGKRSRQWEEFHFTAEDNPRISKQAFQDLVDEYVPGDPSLEQEVYARLLRGGVGVALSKLDPLVHFVPRIPLAEMPATWRHFGGFDWGYNHPWCFGWYVADDDGNVLKVDTVWGRLDEPEDIGRKIVAAGVPVERIKLVFAGHDIWSKKGKAVGYNGPTIKEQLSAFKLHLLKANIDRVQGLNNLRRFTYWEMNERHEVTRWPQFVFMDTEGNKKCFHQMAAMQIDPDDLEDALKVDANAKGEGGDDGYDETRYALMSRWRSVRPKDYGHVPGDRVRKIDYQRRQLVEAPHAADDFLSGGGRTTPRVGSPRVRTLRRGGGR